MSFPKFNIVFFQHPRFLGSQSMGRFADMLHQAFEARGYAVQAWAPEDRLHRRFAGTRWAKWAGYIDQYVLFPRSVQRRLATQPAETLYVFCDQALGPWVPRVADRPHAVHCHDLLALRSALGEIPENPTGWTGRIYQRYIRRGFRHAQHFIAVSQKSRDDLMRFVDRSATQCSVVYNGLNPSYHPIPPTQALQQLAAADMTPPPQGFLLHVGGGQWYKNREGVLRLYAHYAQHSASPLPLWLVGPPANAAVEALLATVPAPGEVRFFRGLSNETLAAAYSTARAFLFPSLAEGFGWPIAEALACGCPVITTNEAPMNEVGGDAAHYLPRLQRGQEAAWAAQGAALLSQVLAAAPTEREARARHGQQWVRRFDAQAAIDAYEQAYQRAYAAARPIATAPVQGMA